MSTVRRQHPGCCFLHQNGRAAYHCHLQQPRIIFPSCYLEEMFSRSLFWQEDSCCKAGDTSQSLCSLEITIINLARMDWNVLYSLVTVLIYNLYYQWTKRNWTRVNWHCWRVALSISMRYGLLVLFGNICGVENNHEGNQSLECSSDERIALYGDGPAQQCFLPFAYQKIERKHFFIIILTSNIRLL